MAAEEEPIGPKWFKPHCFVCWTTYSLVFSGAGISILLDSFSARHKSDRVKERILGGTSLGAGIAIAVLLTPHVLARRRKVLKEEQEERQRQFDERKRREAMRRRLPQREDDFPMGRSVVKDYADQDR